jgi:hypothetical protein
MLLRQQPDMVHGITDHLEKTLEGSLNLTGTSQDGVKLPLMKLFLTFEYSEVSVARDRLFAMLGLASDGADKDLRPNYDESTEEVLLRYAKTFIKNGQGLDVLYGAGMVGRDAQIPSWVPDWTQLARNKSKPLAFCAHTGETYKAAADIPSAFRFSNNICELITSGGYLDEISKLLYLPLPDFEGDEGEAVYLAKLTEFFLEVDGLASNGMPYVTGEPLVEVKRRTLVGNRSVRPRIAPKEYGDDYSTFRRSVRESNERGSFTADFYNTTELSKRLLSINQMYAVYETKNGLVGMVPRGTLVGDSIYLISGATMSFVMRPHAVKECLQIVGPCYVHGMMDGEGLRSEGWAVEDIHIL